MKKKKTVIYDNYYDCERFDETKQFLFNEYAEDNDWQTVDDVPNDRVFDEMNFQDECYWNDFKHEMDRLLEHNVYIMTGTCGRWDGPCSGGTFICSFSDFIDAIHHLDYLEIYDENGHLYIKGSHHDGDDFYEMKRLTNKGRELADNNYYAHDRHLHTTIMKYNFYSALPRLSKVLYGA